MPCRIPAPSTANAHRQACSGAAVADQARSDIRSPRTPRRAGSKFRAVEANACQLAASAEVPGAGSGPAARAVANQPLWRRISTCPADLSEDDTWSQPTGYVEQQDHRAGSISPTTALIGQSTARDDRAAARSSELDRLDNNHVERAGYNTAGFRTARKTCIDSADARPAASVVSRTQRLRNPSWISFAAMMTMVLMRHSPEE